MGCLLLLGLLGLGAIVLSLGVPSMGLLSAVAVAALIVGIPIALANGRR